MWDMFLQNVGNYIYSFCSSGRLPTL